MEVTSLRLQPKPVYRLLTNSACMATVLHVICLAKYGEEIYQVEPMELFLRLEEDFGAKLAEENENKLTAMLMATSTDIFYENAEAFRGMCNTFSDGDPGIDYLDGATLAEMMWAVYEVEINHGPGQLGPAVQRLFQQAMDGESDDFDDPDNPDASGDPYGSLKGFMTQAHERLCRQMAELGVPNRDIPPLDPAMVGAGQEVAMEPVSGL